MAHDHDTRGPPLPAQPAHRPRPACASSFLLLLLTGLVLLWGPLVVRSPRAATRGWLHRVAAIGFMAVPVVYWFTDREGAKELLVDSFKYDRDDIEWLKHLYRYALGHADRDAAAGTAQRRPEAAPRSGRDGVGVDRGHGLAHVVLQADPRCRPVWPGRRSSTTCRMLALDPAAGRSPLLHLRLQGAVRHDDRLRRPKIEARLEHAKWVDELEAEAEAAAGRRSRGRSRSCRGGGGDLTRPGESFNHAGSAGTPPKKNTNPKGHPCITPSVATL